jgi:hypothetical protein
LASPVLRVDPYEPLKVKVEIIPLTTTGSSVAAAEPRGTEQAIVVPAPSGEQALREANAVQASAHSLAPELPARVPLPPRRPKVLDDRTEVASLYEPVSPPGPEGTQ